MAGSEGGPVRASLTAAFPRRSLWSNLVGMTTTSPDTSRIAVILASVRDGRAGPAFAGWVGEQAAMYGFDVDVIDLAAFELPLALPAASPKGAGDEYPRPEAMRDLTARLDAADGFVIVTPEYNHSYPASLKAAIDWHFTQWQAKPVAFTSYGGWAGGRHAVLHLENVFTELHAVTIQAGLLFPTYWEHLDDAGRPTDPDAPVAAKAMFDQLAWWAGALRAARAEVPYPG